MFPHLLQTKQYLDWRFNKYFNSQHENEASSLKTFHFKNNIKSRKYEKNSDEV